MQVVLQQQQASRNYVLAKIDRVYTEQKVAEAKKRFQVARKHRRRLASARAKFQRELDKVIGLKTQEGLGIEVIANPKHLPRLCIVARFEFLGKQWLVSRKKSLWGCQWHFGIEGQDVFTCCTTSDLEDQLCYALGKYKNSISSKVPTLMPLQEA